jgi:hypothetical protein
VFVEAQQDGNIFKRLLRRHEMSQLLKECNAGLSLAFDAFKVHIFSERKTTSFIA